MMGGGPGGILGISGGATEDPTYVDDVLKCGVYSTSSNFDGRAGYYNRN